MFYETGTKVKIISVEIDQFGEKRYRLESIDKEDRIYPAGYIWCVLARVSSFYKKRTLCGYQYMLSEKITIDETKLKTERINLQIKL